MDILWLIGIFLGVNLLCGNSFAHISVLPISKDFKGHGTQYRFQYYVRDERGDYKTQEEAGEGGKSRGSYAVQEPDGDLRIVQYTADIGEGFKAHIKVDHAGSKTPSNLQEIEIPAEEMRKLIKSNRKNLMVEEENTEFKMDNLSKRSYVLGPPKKMSEIVMEQAAAIREIISKEIEANKKREAEEKLINKNIADDVIDVVEEKIEKEKKIEPEIREPKLIRIVKNEEPSSSGSLESLKNSQLVEKDDETIKIPASSIVNEEIQSPVVRVELTPRKIDDIEKPIMKKLAIQIPGESGIKNMSFKNRIMFYKPLEKNITISQNQSEEVDNDRESNLKDLRDDNDDDNNEKKDIPKRLEEIVLYSPYQNEGGNKGDGNYSRFITVPYEVLRPYLSRIEKDEKNIK